MSWPSSGTASLAATPNTTPAKRQKLDITEQPAKADDDEEPRKPNSPEPQNPPAPPARSACQNQIEGVPPSSSGHKAGLGFANASDLFSDGCGDPSVEQSKVSDAYVSDKTQQQIKRQSQESAAYMSARTKKEPKCQIDPSQEYQSDELYA